MNLLPIRQKQIHRLKKRISDEPSTKTLETEILTEDAINTDDTHETDEVSIFINEPLDKFLDINDVIRIFSGPFAILGEIPVGKMDTISS
ncbi:hypothetical protein DPMN_015450 [Dreissena polymorpha]|uniref:Uncharacterized protein n=1 Tax=Dreissena polymorpha TaxID=45954 RepID=A0A9D4NCN4_DREPO|nr:hypothetical protein DPMN_015450 [Dreissena polymorpha]